MDRFEGRISSFWFSNDCRTWVLLRSDSKLLTGSPNTSILCPFSIRSSGAKFPFGIDQVELYGKIVMDRSRDNLIWSMVVLIEIFNRHIRVQEHYSWLEICLQVHFYYYIEASFPFDPMRSVRVQPHDTSSRLYGSSWIVGVWMSLGMNVNTTTLVKNHRHCDKRKHKDDTASINTLCPIIWFLQSCRPDQLKNCIARWSYKCWIDPRTVIIQQQLYIQQTRNPV